LLRLEYFKLIFESIEENQLFVPVFGATFDVLIYLIEWCYTGKIQKLSKGIKHIKKNGIKNEVSERKNSLSLKMQAAKVVLNNTRCYDIRELDNTLKHVFQEFSKDIFLLTRPEKPILLSKLNNEQDLIDFCSELAPLALQFKCREIVGNDLALLFPISHST